jgi:hypothetical protein
MTCSPPPRVRDRCHVGACAVAAFGRPWRERAGPFRLLGSSPILVGRRHKAAGGTVHARRRATTTASPRPPASLSERQLRGPHHITTGRDYQVNLEARPTTPASGTSNPGGRLVVSGRRLIGSAGNPVGLAPLQVAIWQLLARRDLDAPTSDRR